MGKFTKLAMDQIPISYTGTRLNPGGRLQILIIDPIQVLNCEDHSNLVLFEMSAADKKVSKFTTLHQILLKILGQLLVHQERKYEKSF